MTFRRLAFYCIVLLFMAGCAYTRSHQLPTVLTTSEWRGIIPKGQTFKAMQSPREGLKDFTFPDNDMAVLPTGNLQELAEAANAAAIKASRVQKERMMWGGAVTSLAGVLGTVLWRSRKKMKIEGSLKGEA